MAHTQLLLDIYQAMLTQLGPSGWWPGETPFEIAVGAILTQNTTWKNVEKAIANLKSSQALSPHRMHELLESPPKAASPHFHNALAECIRPAGYYNVKAKRLAALLNWLAPHGDDAFGELKKQGVTELRPSLLAVKGVGPETADSILLYALNKPTFVVDAYTHRIFHRHAIIPEDILYEELRALFMDSLEPEVPFFNEYHALLVRTGKEWCHKRTPDCASCPLRHFLENSVGSMEH